LFIPDYFDQEDDLKHKEFKSEIWDHLLLHPKIALEFCAGNGQWVLDQAKNHPDTLWIACELRYDRVKKIYKKLKAERLSNVLIAFGYAETLTRYYLKPQILDAVYVNFPDPWPKKRHAKNRLFQTSFIEDLKPAMKSGSKLTLVSDDKIYIDESIQTMKNAGFQPSFNAPHFIPLNENYGSSFFEDLWIKKGKQNLKTELCVP